MHWDIFCRVIDNHGDIGVCWRLACNLAARGETVRLWADDLSALAWMAPGGAPGVTLADWSGDSPLAAPGDIVIEGFGCDLPAGLLQAMAARSPPPLWINLEYLTAEAFAQRAHGLPSPVLSGPGAGLAKRFFYPGFAAQTGGLLREQDLLARQSRFDRVAWLQQLRIDPQRGRLVSLFCYEPRALAALLLQLQQAPEPTQLLVTAGRATAAVRAQLQDAGKTQLSVTYLPLLTQDAYDHLLWACDFNFVRGEDSLVRALWAGRPFCWQLYPQDDGAEQAKLAAFLDRLDAPAGWRDFHRCWNGQRGALPQLDPVAWLPCARAARDRLLHQDDLVTQLLRFVRVQRPSP